MLFNSYLQFSIDNLTKCLMIRTKSQFRKITTKKQHEKVIMLHGLDE